MCDTSYWSCLHSVSIQQKLFIDLYGIFVLWLIITTYYVVLKYMTLATDFDYTASRLSKYWNYLLYRPHL